MPLVGPLQLAGGAGGRNLPVWVFFGLQVLDHFLKAQQVPLAVPVCGGFDESTRLELATCRNELVSALTCPLDQGRDKKECECNNTQWDEYGHWALEVIGLLCAGVGLFSFILEKLCHCCRSRLHHGSRREAGAGQTIAEVQAVGRRRRGGSGVVV